jgi:predicted metal-dependent hydrolase
MNETLHIGDLTFEVRRSTRRRTVGLTVDRRGELVIHAHEDIAAAQLERWTRKKLVWVHRKLALKQRAAPAASQPEFVSGERLSYLGRSCPLKIVRELEAPLRFNGTHFWLRQDALRTAPEHFRRWYILAGHEWLIGRVDRLAQKTGTKASGLNIRELGFRWGSCGKNSVLYFDWRIMQLPVRLIDYVVVHELVHLGEPHHGESFWQAVERALPSWQRRREELEHRAAEFLVFGIRPTQPN